MPILKKAGRRKVEVAYVDFLFSDLVSGSDLPAIDLPIGAVLLAGNVTTTIAFNSATTDVIDVGDAGLQNRYLNDGNIHATGIVPIVPTGYVGKGETVTVRWVGAGAAPSAGAATLTLSYYVQAREDSTFDN